MLLVYSTPGVRCGLLRGLLQFHSESLRSRLDSLPRGTTLSFGNALDLMETGSGIANVSGIFQGLLALLWESELCCGYTITSSGG
jgi:hypothetical protein